MKALGSVAAVIAAVREDAQADVEAIEREAADAVAAVAAAAQAPVTPGNTTALAAARERARTRTLARGRERLLSARADARSFDARREAMARLAAEGVARLPAGPIVIVVDARDEALLDEAWRSQIGRGDSSALTIVSRAIGGGCIVQSADGRAVFDNTYDARIERLQARWRSVLFEIYERATAGVAVGKAAP